MTDGPLIRIGDVMARCRSRCSVEEYEVLSLAYGQKREHLDRIRGDDFQSAVGQWSRIPEAG